MLGSWNCHETMSDFCLEALLRVCILQRHGKLQKYIQALLCSVRGAFEYLHLGLNFELPNENCSEVTGFFVFKDLDVDSSPSEMNTLSEEEMIFHTIARPPNATLWGADARVRGEIDPVDS